MQRVVIVGHGSIGKRHLRIIRETQPDVEIMVLRHRPTTDIPEFADYVSASLADAVAFAPQIAVIANPAPFHIQTANALAEVGGHLLIEKPIAADAIGVSELLALVRSSGLVCQIGYNLRFLPSLTAFRRLVHEGLVGRPMSVRCEIGQYLPDWRPGTDYRLGVSARGNLGGGVMLELSHEIDYLRWIFGEVEWVSAWIGKLSQFQIDVEDCAHLTMGFSSSQEGKEVVASLTMDFMRRDTTRICTVIGNEGSLRWNGVLGLVELFRPGAKTWIELLHLPNGRDDSYRAQWVHFLRCVQTGEPPLVDGEAGLAVLKIVEAAKQSAQRQCQCQTILSRIENNG